METVPYIFWSIFLYPKIFLVVCDIVEGYETYVHVSKNNNTEAPTEVVV